MGSRPAPDRRDRHRPPPRDGDSLVAILARRERQAALERERRWALPAALSAFGAVAALVASTVIVGAVSGDGDAEVLLSVNEHSAAVTVSGLLQALSFLLLLPPLLYLFRAAEARSDKVRGQLVGLVVAAPLFLAGSAVLTATTTNSAADEFVAGKATTDLTPREATRECRSDRGDDATAFRDDYGRGQAALTDCAATKVADDEAANALSAQSARDLGFGLGLGGRLGLAFGLLYSCLWAMRTGLLTRFWGSLGMAMGVAALLLLIQFTFIWFLYFAFMLLGWVPGGRPPAWQSGKAEPWPTPGEKAAEELSPPEER